MLTPIITPIARLSDETRKECKLDTPHQPEQYDPLSKANLQRQLNQAQLSGYTHLADALAEILAKTK